MTVQTNANCVRPSKSVLNKRCIDIALSIYIYPKYKHTNIIRNPVKLDTQRNICVKKNTYQWSHTSYNSSGTLLFCGLDSDDTIKVINTDLLLQF